MMIKKIKSIKPEELRNYGEQYNITLTKKQAEEITSFLGRTNLDPVKEHDRLKLFKKLAQITNLETAQKAQKIFNKLIKEHGVESWFN